jgi:hypothetical protein
MVFCIVRSSIFVMFTANYYLYLFTALFRLLATWGLTPDLKKTRIESVRTYELEKP